MTKISMKMFFNNLDLAFVQKYLSFESIDKMKVLLTRLPYGKITW